MATSISLYQASVPMMIKGLRNLNVLLTKADDFAKSKPVPEETLINHRLIEDMRGLAYQVQSCSDTCKFMAVRVGKYPPTKMEDTETTFAELHQRIDKTLTILQSLSPDCMDGDVHREIRMETARMGTYEFNALDYVVKYCIPNFHFHLTTAYCLLRTQGVPISAFDYLDADKNLFKKVA